MDPLSSTRPAVLAPAPTALPPEKAAETQEIVHAIKALNATEMFGKDNELLFQRDRDTQRMIIRLVNRTTGEVVSQIPPEYVLRLARQSRPARP